MIKWNCAFNIPNSSIQVGEAFIKVVEYKNINDKSLVTIRITGETEDIIIKDYVKEYPRLFTNQDEIYEELLLEFENSQIVSS